MTEPVIDPAPELVEAAAVLLGHSEIVDVRPLRISAEMLAVEPKPVAFVSFSPHLEHATGEGVYMNRFTFSFEFKGLDDEIISRMEFVMAVEWSVEQGFTPDEEAAGFVASTTGYFAAFPYVRELAQSCSARLGLDPLVLGALKRGALKPDSVIAVRR